MERYSDEGFMDVVGSVPDPLFGEQNPLKLVRAVNALRGLSKEEAISLLRKFRSDYRPFCSLMPLVFRPDETVPRSATFWIEVQEDIPFHVRAPGPGFAPGELVVPSVAWAASHGKFQQGLLRPSDDPLGAADRLLDRLVAAGRLVDVKLRRHVRWQGWRMVAEVLGSASMNEPPARNLTNERTWGRMLSEVAALRIHWNEEKQVYEQSSGTSPIPSRN
jgi:hypothetical protein